MPNSVKNPINLSSISKASTAITEFLDYGNKHIFKHIRSISYGSTEVPDEVVVELVLKLAKVYNTVSEYLFYKPIAKLTLSKFRTNASLTSFYSNLGTLLIACPELSILVDIQNKDELRVGIQRGRYDAVNLEFTECINALRHDPCWATELTSKKERYALFLYIQIQRQYGIDTGFGPAHPRRETLCKQIAKQFK